MLTLFKGDQLSLCRWEKLELSEFQVRGLWVHSGKASIIVGLALHGVGKFRESGGGQKKILGQERSE